MVTAIEMWEAFRHGKTVVAISPLSHNWTVKYCSNVLYPDVESFEAELANGRLRERLKSCSLSPPRGEG